MNDIEQLQAVLEKLKKAGHDVRIVHDAPKGTISFQGCIKKPSKEEKKHES